MDPVTLSPQDADLTKSRVSSLLLVTTIILISILQAFLFLLLKQNWFGIAAGVISIANLVLAIRFLLIRKQVGSIGNAFGMYFLQAIFFAVAIFGSLLPPDPRLLVVALSVLHCAMLFSAFLALTGVVPQPRAILLCLSFAGGIFLLETALPIFIESPFQKEATGPQWIGTMQPYPGLGAVYSPGSVLSTLYAENPRRYFKEQDDRALRWWLRLDGGNEGTLIFPQESPELVRVETKKVQTKNAYDVQLNLSKLKVVKKQAYKIGFRARADQPRGVFIGFAMSHDPWDGLGLYQKIDLTETWQTFSIPFSATANDENARIHFDLGDSTTPAEFTSVSLRAHPAGTRIEPQLPPKKYIVTYRFNSLGCRDRDYTIPKPQNTKRILFLGDSFTLGVGVHEQDTVPRQLETLISAGASEKKYEVINCGVSGYGTHEERMFYKLFGANYQPDVVLLMMVWNDDLSYREEFEKDYVKRPPGKLELLFHTWAKIQQYRHQRPFPNFSKCVDEILRLDGELRNHSSRLGVVIYRNDPDFEASTYPGKIWNHLTRTVTGGLEGENIPVLDLGKPLFEKHSKVELDVHPTIDHHPNEVANGIAAQEILRFLEKQSLLKQ
ncbi:GDSL-type esterase/lipase family protein [bacterium]|nr:GDSL-type esterase/lipase family protein [bacterium]MCI0602675.1 GDSL-type esterase/lipase family protein [bacterium]